MGPPVCSVSRSVEEAALDDEWPGKPLHNYVQTKLQLVPKPPPNPRALDAAAAAASPNQCPRDDRCTKGPKHMGRCKTDGVGLPSPGALVSAQDSSETLVESHAAAPKAAALPDECRPCERPSSQASGEGVV